MNAAAVDTRRKRFAAKLDKLINDAGIQQVNIAQALGYDNANIITMFKKGATRVPLDRVVPLARALGADPAEMLRDWFEAYMPGTIADIEAQMGMVMSSAERSWIHGLRKIFGTVPMFDERAKESIRSVLRHA